MNIETIEYKNIALEIKGLVEEKIDSILKGLKL
jgi:hypothetical protein